MDSKRLSSAVCHVALGAVSRLTVRCHYHSLPPGLVTLTKLKLLPATISKVLAPCFSSRSPTFLPCSHFPADSFTKFIACRPSSFIHQNQVLPRNNLTSVKKKKTFECLWLLESPISSHIALLLTNTQA
jgi:hypothetical protein